MLPFLRILRGVAALCLALVASSAAADAAIPVYGYQVVHAYPHDPDAFTEGLLFRKGFLYESTGLNGHSSVRKVKLETGEVLQSTALPADVFGEGISDWGDQIIGLTWQSHIGFVLDLATFKFVRQF
ncbi:MAG TPA: glutaminyl-peptide cyclotransferase, partial [Burkholderiaceae bacterium]|nr:glutaminyl-peptide cyclotransferase [Burkholderiaceae bacterium]